MTRLVKTPRTFSREKNIVVPDRETLDGPTAQVVAECTELRSIRERYHKLVRMFNLFTQQNGPAIIGTDVSTYFIRFKDAFEAFILQAKHYFNSSARAQTIRRFSPIVDFSAKLLQAWTEFVTTVNDLAHAKRQPHQDQITFDFELLKQDVSQLLSTFVKRRYHRDILYEASQRMEETVNLCSEKVLTVISSPQFGEDDIPILQKEVVLVSRDIEDKFIAILPKAATGTPEMTRLRMHVRSVCGEIVSLIGAMYHFRERITNLLLQMSVLHVSICGVLDRVGLQYDIQISPLLLHDEVVIEESEHSDAKDESPGDRALAFVRGVGEILNVDLDGVKDTADEIDIVEQALLTRLSSQENLRKKRHPTERRIASARRPKTRAPSRMSQMQSIPSLPHVSPIRKGQTMKNRRPMGVPHPPTSSPASTD